MRFISPCIFLISVIFGAIFDYKTYHETPYYQAHKNQMPMAFYYPNTSSVGTENAK
jgi:hypothetical protein